MTTASLTARLHILRNEAAACSVDLGTLAERLGDRATATLLLLCGLTGLVPGVAVIFSFPLCVLGLGLMVGQQEPWLPGFVRARVIPGPRLAEAIDRLMPRLHWLERQVRPRACWAVRGPARRVAGIAAVTCGVLILLPIPFGNTAPSIAVIILAAGLLVRDGVAVLAGLGCTAAALALDVLLLFAGYEALLRITALFV